MYSFSIVVCITLVLGSYTVKAADMDSSDAASRDSVVALFNAIDFDVFESDRVWWQMCSPYGIVSGSRIYFCSHNVRLLFEISMQYNPSLAEGCYRLYDTVQSNLIEDVRSKSGNGQFEFIRDNTHIADLKKLYRHYRAWIRLLKKEGMAELRRKGISPLHGTPYKWI